MTPVVGPNIGDEMGGTTVVVIPDDTTVELTDVVVVIAGIWGRGSPGAVASTGIRFGTLFPTAAAGGAAEVLGLVDGSPTGDITVVLTGGVIVVTGAGGGNVGLVGLTVIAVDGSPTVAAGGATELLGTTGIMAGTLIGVDGSPTVRLLPAVGGIMGSVFGFPSPTGLSRIGLSLVLGGAGPPVGTTGLSGSEGSS
jgi:hypothetical protein